MQPQVSIVVPVYNVEDYVDGLLNSVKEQTFTDFEVLIINDGSTDGSQKIIDRYCQQDERFKSYYQENGGVASARNLGLDLATGKYIAFFDSDDFVYPNALRWMVSMAEKRHADLVIGILEGSSLNDTFLSKATVRLGERKKIDKFNSSLNRTFSTCNKLYRYEVIKKFNLKFQPFRYGEDAQFVFEFIHNCESITGCNKVVYRYQQRLFWNNSSITQALDNNIFLDTTQCYANIIKLVNISIDKEIAELKEKNATEKELERREKQCQAYLSNLYRRFIETNFLGQYYRYLWRFDDEMVKLISTQIDKYKTQISSRVWEAICRKQSDLRLNRPLMTKEELCREPLISFVLSDRIPLDKVQRIAEALYYNSLPAFEILVHKKIEHVIPEEIKSRRNVRIIEGSGNLAAFKSKALNKLNGEFVNFIDEDIFVSRRSVRLMYKIMVDENNEQPDFVTTRLNRMTDKGFRKIRCHDMAFLYEFTEGDIHTIYNKLDWMWGNKLFRVSTLKSMVSVFSRRPAADIWKLYKKLKYVKAEEIALITEMGGKEILERAKSRRIKRAYELAKASKNK